MPHTLQIDGGSESQKTYPLVNQTESGGLCGVAGAQVGASRKATSHKPD